MGEEGEEEEGDGAGYGAGEGEGGGPGGGRATATDVAALQEGGEDADEAEEFAILNVGEVEERVLAEKWGWSI